MVANQLGKNPDSATHHLKLARSLMRQSQVDLRRSVWGLRSRAEEEFNLTNALITSVRQITDDTGIRIEVETVGEAGPLSEIVEENLLRIGQEAVTNVVKHSGRPDGQIQLQFSPQKVVLQIEDNGIGFDPEACAGPKERTFWTAGHPRKGRTAWTATFRSPAHRAQAPPSAFEIPFNSTNGDQLLQPSAEDHEERS